MNKQPIFLTLFTLFILIFPYQADAFVWKLIKHAALESIATEMIKNGIEGRQIKNTCYVMALGVAHTYYARVDGMSHTTFRSKMKDMKTNLKSQGLEEDLIVNVMQMQKTISHIIYETPLSEFPVNSDNTAAEKKQSAEEIGSKYYEECRVVLFNNK